MNHEWTVLALAACAHNVAFVCNVLEPKSYAPLGNAAFHSHGETIICLGKFQSFSNVLTDNSEVPLVVYCFQMRACEYSVCYISNAYIMSGGQVNIQSAT